MLLRLALGYFFHKRKTTYLAVIILAVNMSVVIATNLLINGFIQEVAIFSSGVGENPSGERYFMIYNEDGINADPFSDETLAEIESTLSNSAEVADFNPYYNFVANVSIGQNFGNYYIGITNISKLLEHNILKINNPGPEMTVYTNSLLSLNLTGISLKVNYSTTTLDISPYSFFSAIDPIGQDLLIDYQYSKIELNLQNGFNAIQVFLNLIGDFDTIKSDLSAIGGISVEMQNPISTYLDKSGNQILAIIIVLQNIMALLLILSLGYISLNLLQELKFDLRIKRMMGFTQTQILKFFIYILFTTILLSIATALYFTYIVIHIIAAVLSLFLGFQFLLIKIDFEIIWLLVWQSAFITALASIYPFYKEVLK